MLKIKKLGILMLVASFAITLEAKKEPKTLTMVGSTTVLPIAQRIAEKFMEKHPEVNISVRGGGSGVGIAALIDGTCDIATSSRAIKPKEIEDAKAKGVNPFGTVIANDGIAVIVHPSNPVKELSLEQLKAIYTGKIKKWSEVGGEDKPIVVISRDVASGTFEVFNELVLKKEKTREDAVMLASNKAVATTVKDTPSAIGYVGLGYISKDVKNLIIEGVAPTKEKVLSGEYKINRPLYFYTNGEPKGLVKEFIDFTLSKESQKIIEDMGFIPVK